MTKDRAERLDHLAWNAIKAGSDVFFALSVVFIVLYALAQQHQFNVLRQYMATILDTCLSHMNIASCAFVLCIVLPAIWLAYSSTGQANRQQTKH